MEKEPEPTKKHDTTPHVKDEGTAQEVETLSSFGVPQAKIASFLGISRTTLMKHYREELDNAGTRLITEVAGHLMDKIRTHKDITAIIFFLKTRGRWSEKHAPVLDDEVETMIGGVDRDLLTESELEMMADLSNSIRERAKLLENDGE